MADWHDTTSIKLVWSSAPEGDLLQDLLDAAQAQIVEFVGLDPDDLPESIPANYRVAHGLQTRAVWESQNVAVAPDPDQIGGEYSVRAYSMAKPVRDLLRPPHSIPGIG